MLATDYFNHLLDAISKKVAEEIPEFKSVTIFAGGFNGVDDAKKFTTSAPSCKVGLSSITPALNTNTGQLDATMELSIVFITKDITTAGSRHKIALSILEKLLLLVKDGEWGVENTYPTDRSSVEAKNYYGSELIVEDIAMWQVNWKQRCLLGQDRFYEVGKLPKIYRVNTHIDNDKVVDEEYEQNV